MLSWQFSFLVEKFISVEFQFLGDWNRRDAPGSDSASEWNAGLNWSDVDGHF
jgi:hypothetical protein